MATKRYRLQVLRAALDSRSRETLSDMAAVAETAERYTDMVHIVKRIPAASTGPLSVEERNLISVAYKNVVGQLRASWRKVSSICEKEARASAEEWQLLETRRYRERLEGDLHDVCHELLDLVTIMLEGKGRRAASETNADGKVFFLKLAADFIRYLAEVQTGDNRAKLCQQALAKYEEGVELSSALRPAHPIRLGIHLNFSVFLYEIMGEPARACRLAQAAFNEAHPTVDTLSDVDFKDALLIMQLIRDNLLLWTADLQPATTASGAGAGSGPGGDDE